MSENEPGVQRRSSDLDLGDGDVVVVRLRRGRRRQREMRGRLNVVHGGLVHVGSNDAAVG